MRLRELALCVLGAILAACADEQPTASVERAADGYSDDGPYLFRDATETAGLAGFAQVNGDAAKRFLVETVGGGCALFDCDGDGDLDVYLTQGGVLGRPWEENPSDRLYVNDGQARFADGSAGAGIDERRWTNGVRVCDVDGDGWSDLFLTNYGRNTFLQGREGGRFTDRTEEVGLSQASWSTGASFFDFDKDGDLDLHVANYVLFDEPAMLAHPQTMAYQGVEVMKGPRGLPGAPDWFYVNEGGLSFHEKSVELGLVDDLYGFQSVAFDYDLDGWVDLFVGNDSVGNNLWHNLEGQRFVDTALRQGIAFSLSGRAQACMGVTVGDFDGDLRPDVYVTNFADDYSTLFHGQERGFFLDMTQALGLAAPTMDKLAWGTGFEDFDLDGDLELYAVNGHVYPQVDRFPVGTEYRQPLQLFELADGRFREPPGRGGRAFAAKASGRGSASGDVDGDGDRDLLIENIDGPPRLLLNDGSVGRALEVLLLGAGRNREAIGARLVGRVGERWELRLAGIASGFLSSSERCLYFGLGAHQRLDELEVTWPSGRVERFPDLAAGTRVTIEEQSDGDARVTVEPAR